MNSTLVSVLKKSLQPSGFDLVFYLVLGDNCTVLCVVLLPATSDSTMEPYEAEMGRHLMHCPVDWSSDALAVMGIHARV